jgi:Domain of unknown function (DUF6531)
MFKKNGSFTFVAVLAALTFAVLCLDARAQDLCEPGQIEAQGGEDEGAGFLVGHFQSKLPPRFTEGKQAGVSWIDLLLAQLQWDARFGLRNGKPRYPEKEDPEALAGKAKIRPARPASEANSAIRGSGLCPTASGVVIATGEQILSQVDVRIAGLYGLSLERTYRSAGAAGTLFGANWPSSLDPSRVSKSTSPCINTEVGCIPPDATVTFPDGSRYKYTWMPTSPGEYQVKGAASMGTLSTSRYGGTSLVIGSRTYSFNAGGTQLSVMDTDGVSITYAYSATGTSTVTNRAGRVLTFTRGSNGRVN